MMNDRERKEHTRLRLRLLRGQHEGDVRRTLVDHIGPTRADVWGTPDLSANPFAESCGQGAILYDATPAIYPQVPSSVTGPDAVVLGAEMQRVRSAVLDSMHFLKMQEVQRLTLGLRECAVLVEPVGGGVRTKVVTPDQLDVEVDRHGEWASVKWTVPYKDREQAVILFDPARRVCAAYDQHGKDVSIEVLGGDFSGDAYPYLDGAKNPVLPWVCYRAAFAPETWDAYRGREAVHASLVLGVLYTFYAHSVKNAAWAQKWAVNAFPMGMGVEGEQRVASIVTDPSSILLFDSEEGKQAALGSFALTLDPAKLLESIVAYEDRVLRGIFGSQVTRQTSDVRSGYSLAVAREALMQLQARSLPLFRAGDQKVCSLAAGYLGLDPALSEPRRWTIFYPSVEQAAVTPGGQADSELQVAIEDALDLLGEGASEDAAQVLTEALGAAKNG